MLIHITTITRWYNIIKIHLNFLSKHPLVQKDLGSVFSFIQTLITGKERNANQFVQMAMFYTSDDCRQAGEHVRFPSHCELLNIPAL